MELKVLNDELSIEKKRKVESAGNNLQGGSDYSIPQHSDTLLPDLGESDISKGKLSPLLMRRTKLQDDKPERSDTSSVVLNTTF